MRHRSHQSPDKPPSYTQECFAATSQHRHLQLCSPGRGRPRTPGEAGDRGRQAASSSGRNPHASGTPPGARTSWMTSEGSCGHLINITEKDSKQMFSITAMRAAIHELDGQCVQKNESVSHSVVSNSVLLHGL